MKPSNVLSKFLKTNAAKNQLAQHGLKGRKEATNNLPFCGVDM
jgi:hypothetical protein